MRLYREIHCKDLVSLRDYFKAIYYPDDPSTHLGQFCMKRIESHINVILDGSGTTMESNNFCEKVTDFMDTPFDVKLALFNFIGKQAARFPDHHLCSFEIRGACGNFILKLHERKIDEPKVINW